MNSDHDITSIVTWLMAGAPPPGSLENLVEAFAEQLISAGFPIDSIALYKYNIHPIFPANGVQWTKKRGVRQQTIPHDFIGSQDFQNSPQATTIRDRRMLRYQLKENDNDDLQLPTISSYRKSGYTDVVALPLFNVDGSTNKSLLIGTRHDNGFSDDQVRHMRRLQAPIARVSEHFGDRSDMEVVLSTYLGKETGRKVLDGRIQRGDGDTISAVILFVDIVGFTDLSNSLPATEVLRILNDFFEVINSSVVANYGEILKFMGDGALVIFPVVDDLTAQEAAARNALNAITLSRVELQGHDDVTAIEFRASLHVGEIFYGNIGSQSRLDFTAIGPAVNLASRLLEKAGALNAKTVCSEAFKSISNVVADSGTSCELKGFEQPISIYTVD